MNSKQQYRAEPMTNNPSSRWMACSQTAPSHQAHNAAFERFEGFDRQDQRPTRFPTSPTEMSNRESAFYFADEET